MHSGAVHAAQWERRALWYLSRTIRKQGGLSLVRIHTSRTCTGDAALLAYGAMYARVERLVGHHNNAKIG